MTSKTQTEQYLRAVALPEQTESYTVISHGDIIDTVRQMLTDNGFTIKEELYKAEAAGNIALGFMQLENNLDPDMSMTFNWANSYNKQVRFSCAIGGFIYDNNTPFVSGTNQGKWNRKHTGTALDETKEVIEAMIISAHDHFAEIIAMKEQFKSIKLSRKEYAKLSGLFYFDKSLISPEQASVLKKEYDKSSFNYSDKGTLWEYYKMLMFAVVDQPPKSWYKQQTEISNYINIMYNISKTLVAPGEANLDSMHSAEQDANVSDISFEPNVSVQHPVTLEDAHDTTVTENPMESIDKLIDVQNLIKEPMRGPLGKMTEEDEVVQPEPAINFVVEEDPAFDWSMTEEPAVEIKEEVIPTELMSEEQIELVQEEHGIIEVGSPDDNLIGATVQEDEAVEALFELTEDIEEVSEEETPWYTEDEIQTDAAPFAKKNVLIPDSMQEAVDDVLQNSYQNMRRVVDSTETKDGFIFELDSQEFFHVDK